MKIEQTYTCAVCGKEHRLDTYQAHDPHAPDFSLIIRGTPPGWHYLDGQEFCSWECLRKRVPPADPPDPASHPGGAPGNPTTEHP